MRPKISGVEWPVEGKGFECIFPAKQGMQTASNFARESRDMPDTRFSLMARFRAAGLKCIALLCQSSKSSGIRTRCAAATRGTEVSVFGVKPSRYAALSSDIEAV